MFTISNGVYPTMITPIQGQRGGLRECGSPLGIFKRAAKVYFPYASQAKCSILA